MRSTRAIGRSEREREAPVGVAFGWRPCAPSPSAPSSGRAPGIRARPWGASMAGTSRTSGRPREEHLGAARADLLALEHPGITMETVAGEVLQVGVRELAEPFRRPLAVIDERRARLGAPAGR